MVFQLKHIPWNKGLKKRLNTGRTHFTTENSSKEGNWNWKGGKERFPNCLVCDKKLSAMHAKYCRKHFGQFQSQEKHMNWKGGISKNVHSTKEPKYKEWRMKVFTRDNFKCKMFNEDCKGQLQAHHILRWSEFPMLRYDINNGITLCIAHHPRKKAEEKRLTPYFRELMSVSSDNY